MKRMAVLMLALAGVCCSAADEKSSAPPCRQEADGWCQCSTSTTDSNTDSCSVAVVGGSAACCRSERYPGEGGDCHCAPIVCSAENDSAGTCSCGIDRDSGTLVEECTGVCCLNAVAAYCYCTTDTGAECLFGDTPTDTCSPSSMAADGACGSLYTQTTNCNP